MLSYVGILLHLKSLHHKLTLGVNSEGANVLHLFMNL